MAITRTPLIDDDGSFNTGTVINNAWKTELYNQIDAALSSGNGVCDGRLTLTSGVPVTTSDVTGATSIYFTPIRGNCIALYDGASVWALLAFTETALALGTLTSGLPYDVFAYNNAGTLALELLAWTNGTTRATALTRQNGVLVKTGATTRRYLGTFYTTSTTTTEDSLAKRFLWNYYNRVRRGVRVVITTGYSYGTNTIRQANGATTSQVEIVTGVAEDAISLAIDQGITPGAGTVVAVFGFGLDSTTTFDTTNGILSSNKATGVGTSFQSRATWQGIPTAGYHKFSWNEVETQASGATFASQQYTGQAAGINGVVLG